jgi:hypothetical protein
MADLARTGKLGASMNELSLALAMVRQATESPTLLPRHSFRFRSQLLACYLETLHNLLLSLDAQACAGSIPALAGQGFPSGLVVAAQWQRLTPQRISESQLLQRLRLVEQGGRQHPQLRRVLLPQLLTVLPIAQARLLLEDWELDEPQPFVWGHRAELELRAGNPQIALSYCERILKSGGKAAPKISKIQREAREQLQRQQAVKPQ